MKNRADTLVLYGESFKNRLLLGTSRYPSPTNFRGFGPSI